MSIAVSIEKYRVVATATAVEFDTQQAINVDTDTDGSLGESRLKRTNETLAPHLGIIGVVFVIAIEVGITQ
jgi:hypothetical protein